MPAWAIKLLQYLGLELIKKLAQVAKDIWEDYQEERKLKKDIKQKVKALKDAHSKEEIRRAIRDLNI